MTLTRQPVEFCFHCLCFTTCLSDWLAMFKGLISSKRISSDDFIMVSGPGIAGEVPHFGKENKPDVSVMQQRSAPNTPVKPAAQKGSGKINEKHKTIKAKEKEKVTQNQPEEAVVTEDAFDRLLVSLFIYTSPLSVIMLCIIPGRPSNSIDLAAEIGYDGLNCQSSHAEVFPGPDLQSAFSTTYSAHRPESAQQ